MAHLFRVLVPVPDIEKAEAFYREVLGQPGRRVSPERHYFDCGGTILACYDPTLEGGRATPNPENVYLAVDDLEAARDACERAGATFVDADVRGVGKMGEIAERPWGETSFYVTDPFGNPLCFVATDTVFTGG